MRKLTVVGSIAYDSVQTPFGSIEKGFGGSAVHFAMAASIFHPVHMIGVVGEDYDSDFLKNDLPARGINVEGIEVREGEKTFFWKGRYEGDMNEAISECTELNSFATFKPAVKEIHKDTEYLFLANIDPEIQLEVLEQIPSASFSIADTMNFWIESKRDKLDELFRKVTGVILNEGELSLLFPDEGYIEAAFKVLEMGPQVVIAKKGSYGVDAFTKDYIISLPAYLTRDVKDPTGAGDSFGGGMMGYLASNGYSLDRNGLVAAMSYGTVVASLNIEDFSFNRLKNLGLDDIEERLREYRKRQGII